MSWLHRPNERDKLEAELMKLQELGSRPIDMPRIIKIQSILQGFEDFNKLSPPKRRLIFPRMSRIEKTSFGRRRRSRRRSRRSRRSRSSLYRRRRSRHRR